MTEALEAAEVARGHLFAFHRLIGTTDFTLEKAIGKLREAGHPDLARRLTDELLGRNVLPGRWTFQIVEEYDETYHSVFRELEAEVRKLTHDVPHVHEADLKRQRRTAGRPGHEATPGSPA
nr:hypothetical protein [Amycolatopsis xylanica]